MNTEIIPPSSQGAARAGEILRAGGLVAIPTETVYGLAANALDPAAVKKIYEAKGRPSDNPLIVHISSVEQWPELVRGKIPENARKLAEAFWPGPLTPAADWTLWQCAAPPTRWPGRSLRRRACPWPRLRRTFPAGLARRPSPIPWRTCRAG